MINRKNSSWIWQLAVAGLCLVMCVSVWGQSDESSKNSSGDSSAKSAAAGTTPADDESYVIGVDDLLAISVWKEPEISRVVPVRSDGKISLPLVGEVQAASRTPKQLKVELTDKLKNYISEPEVTVIVQETRSKKYNILGQVARPGSYFLNNSATVLDAIAQAGGFRDFAKKKSIYVLRKKPDGTDSRLPFNYKEVISGKNMGQNVKLEPGDTVVVP